MGQDKVKLSLKMLGFYANKAGALREGKAARYFHGFLRPS